MSVVIETTIGDITVDLYMKERPNTCLNFLKLCKTKYYNLCLFHKIERNFIAQTGDPSGTGRGGESVFCQLYGEQAKYFDVEKKPRLKHEKLGTLSMVNNGNDMIGSQFFITLGENLTYLDEDHSVFGEVAEGFDILLKLNEAICDESNRPYQDIRITHTVILHDPLDDPANLSIPDASPEPTKEQLESNYIGVDEEIDDTKGKNIEEIEEKIKESEAKARATILEMVGDIPDADVKPPENVLFVCKLNPVTTSEDLEVIFSRFGTIVSCEVIKDKKSGESLQYAFIEFEKEEDCENAYFKMDNVLIDDRRIHVDFSQSVSKMNWNMDSKFQNPKSGRSQNIVLKNRDKKSDGYEMIFDVDDSTKTKEKGTKPKSNSADMKRNSSRQKESRSIDHHRSTKRSRSPENRQSSGLSKNRSRNQNYSRSRSPEYRQSSDQSKYKPKNRNYSRSRSPEYRHRSEQSKNKSKYLNYSKSRSPEYRHSSELSKYKSKNLNDSKSRSPEYHHNAELSKYKSKNRSYSRSRSPDYRRSFEKLKYRSRNKTCSRSPESVERNRAKRHYTDYLTEDKKRSTSPHYMKSNKNSEKEKYSKSKRSKHSTKDRKHRNRSSS